MQITRKAAHQLAEQEISHRSSALSRKTNKRQFGANFGCSSRVCAFLWSRLVVKGILPSRFLPKHLLWTLVFLKLHCSETMLAILCGCDEKMLQKWVWKGLDLLAELNLVSSLALALRA